MEKNLSKLEVNNLLPEYSRINDAVLKEQTLQALQYMPEYFKFVPASSSGKFHHPIARMEHGLIIHVKQAFVVAERLLPSYIEQGLIDEREADCVRSALLLHDMFKQGLPEDREKLDESERHSTSDHDVVCATFLDEHTDLPEEVINAVERHNGGWYDGGSPETFVDHLVHISDMIASTSNVTVGVWQPHSDIRERYPNLSRAEL